MSRHLTTALAGALLLASCSAPAPPPSVRPVASEPFFPERIAWKLLAEDHGELRPPRPGAEGRLPDAMRAFYGIVGHKVGDDEPRAKRRRVCTKAWRQLARAQKASSDLSEELEIAKAYLANECGWAQKSVKSLRRFVKRYEETDLVFYSAHFWWAESLLELERTDQAIERYRYVLGELDTPLYPLAMYRTAHCYWDDGDVERAREYLGHVIEWTGERESPDWVVSLRRRARTERRDFAE